MLSLAYRLTDKLMQGREYFVCSKEGRCCPGIDWHDDPSHPASLLTSQEPHSSSTVPSIAFRLQEARISADLPYLVWHALTVKHRSV